MGFNFLYVIQKWNDFQNVIKGCNDPRALLDAELKKRNISQSQLNEMLKQAESLKKIIGLK